jgi:hypothetical protein
MPGRDGSGPMGQGSKSGRGLGVCTGVNADRYGARLGRGIGRFFASSFFCRRGLGFRRNINLISASPKTQKQILREKKGLLQKELDFVNQQLEESKED